MQEVSILCHSQMLFILGVPCFVFMGRGHQLLVRLVFACVWVSAHAHKASGLHLPNAAQDVRISAPYPKVMLACNTRPNQHGVQVVNMSIRHSAESLSMEHRKDTPAVERHPRFLAKLWSLFWIPMIRLHRIFRVPQKGS